MPTVQIETVRPWTRGDKGPDYAAADVLVGTISWAAGVDIGFGVEGKQLIMGGVTEMQGNDIVLRRRLPSDGGFLPPGMKLCTLTPEPAFTNILDATGVVAGLTNFLFREVYI